MLERQYCRSGCSNTIIEEVVNSKSTEGVNLNEEFANEEEIFQERKNSEETEDPIPIVIVDNIATNSETTLN